VADLVTLVEGDAHEKVKEVKNPIDLVFLDADKTGYVDYLEKLLPLVRPGGLIVADNTLWSGRVADLANDEVSTVALRRFNEQLHRDERVDLSLVPVGDGLTLARKRDARL